MSGAVPERVSTPLELVAEPSTGRVFETERRVRLGDASPGGRLRFDALVRYLQDVSDDDTRDAGFMSATGWVVRRTTIRVESFPTYLEPMTMRTWCSATGARWAERRISVRGGLGGRIDSATLWVHVDPVAMRPAVLPEEFHDTYGPATQGRRIRANLHHGDPPTPQDVDPAIRRASWTPRFCDFDVLGHVNNSNYWTVVEEELSRRRDLRAPLVAEVEHRDALGAGATADVTVVDGANSMRLWLCEDGSLRASASVEVIS